VCLRCIRRSAIASAILGKFDKALDAAPAKGWTIVSMKDDWAAIFPPTK
jgi:hypothetical protein